MENKVSRHDLAEEITKAMLNARYTQGLTQGELAQRAGLPLSSVVRVETGDGNPTLDTLLKMLMPLGLKLAVVPIEASATKFSKKWNALEPDFKLIRSTMNECAETQLSQSQLSEEVSHIGFQGRPESYTTG